MTAALERLEVTEEHAELILQGAKTQARIPLDPDEPCPVEEGAEVPFAAGGEERGHVRVVDVEPATVYGITLSDALAEGHRGSTAFLKRWQEEHGAGAIHGWCWRLLIELVVPVDPATRKLILTLWGADGRRPLFWNPKPGGETDLGVALHGRHLIQYDPAYRGYVLSGLGRRVAASLKAGRPT